MAGNAVTRFEQVERVPVGAGPNGPEYAVTRMGRPRRPESVPEWTQQQVARLGQFRRLPAGGAVIELLVAGEDFDVRAAGKPLSDWERRGVREELLRLLAAAQRAYPPAAALVRRILTAWTRKWGDGSRLIPPRTRPVPVVARVRTPSLADDPPGAEHWRAVWGSMPAVPRRP
jgi:hypothetical protein